VNDEIEKIRKEAEGRIASGTGGKVARFALAAISGLIPLGGGAVGGIGSTWSEFEQDKFNKIFTTWLKMQEEEIKEIGRTIVEIMMRLDTNDPAIEERLQSPAYLSILKKAFRDWSAAESEEKRILVRNLLTNAAASKLCNDDLIRLFIEWIERYSEPHFAVIKTVYLDAGLTRAEIWQTIHGDSVREDSAEADLFRLLIHDLTLGHIIRQHRETDYHGRFIKRQRAKATKSPFMKSAFEDDKEYELTELGRQFVHYTMNEIVPKIGNGRPSSPADEKTSI
jgi:hypothetical protein